MAKVESRCVPVPSSSVYQWIFIRELRWEVSISLSKSEKKYDFFFLFTSHPWKRKLRTGLLLARTPSRRNFPIMLEQGQLAIASYARRLSILDLSGDANSWRKCQRRAEKSRVYCVTDRGKDITNDAYSFAGRHCARPIRHNEVI